MMAFIITAENGKLVIIKTGYLPPDERSKIKQRLADLHLPWIEAPWRIDWSMPEQNYINGENWLAKHTVEV